LSDEGILEYDEERGEKRCGSAAVETAKSQVCERDCGDTKDRGDHAHSYVWRILVCPERCIKQLGQVPNYGRAFALKLYRNLLCNLGKIKVSIKPRDESRKREKELGQWGVNVHEITRLDVSRGELAKVYFVESDVFRWSANDQLS
jgi:hypothetical protein